MYNIFLTSAAVRNLDKIPRDEQKKIARVLETKFKPDPFSHTLDIKKLEKPEIGYRLRVGDYRVSYTIDTGKRIVTIYRIKHRKDAYR
ncbi:MAG: type II toxin-antitoxin system RelE/ParE family toxin [Minisyncoccia bacterium]|jgi:mRNA interferase RelE/StbE